MSWVVVNFLSKNTVEAVPVNWILNKGSGCFWPPYDPIKLRNSISKCENPSENWETHNVRVLANGKKFDSLAKENTSDLNSEIEEKTRRKKKRYISESESTSSSDADDFPQKLPTPPHCATKSNDGSKTNAILNIESSTSSLLVQNKELPKSPSVSNKLSPISPLMETFSVPKDTVQSISDAIFQKQVLRLLNTIKVKIDQLSEDVNKPPEVPDVNVQKNNDLIWEKFDFPLKTEEDLSSLEDFLANQSDLTQFISTISTIGGVIYKSMVKRLMFKLFSNELGMKYSWIGFKGKNNFSILMIAKAITAAVRNVYTKINDAEVEILIKMWLVKAKERKRLTEEPL